MNAKYAGILTLICVLLAGCASARSGGLNAAFQQDAPAFAVDPSFRAGMDVLADSDGTSHDFDRAAVQNWLLLGVKVARQEAQDIWFVRLSTLAPANTSAEIESPREKEFAVPFGMAGLKTGAKFTAPVGRLRIETFDKDGVLLRASVRTVPMGDFSATLLDILGGASPTASGQAAPASKPADLPSVLTMMQLLGGSKALAPIRESIRDHVLTKPSILAILLHGLRIKVEAKIDQREAMTTPWSTEAAMIPREQAKFPLLLSGQRLFDCRVVVAPPQPPYHLTAGALLIEAVHPEIAENRLTVCVLAARHISECEAPLTTVAARSH